MANPILQRKGKKAVQELFDSNIVPPVIPDSIGGIDAVLSGSYAAINENKIPVLSPKSNFIDGQDFTFFFKIQHFGNDSRILSIIGTDKDNFVLEFRSNRMIVLYINGYSTQHILNIQGSYYLGKIMWVLSYKKSTNTFKLFKNGVKVNTYVGAVNIAGNSNFTSDFTAIESKVEYHLLSYIKEELSEAEILTIGDEDLLVREAAVSRPLISHFWRFSEGIYNSIVVDEIGGVECDIDFSTNEVSSTKELYNLMFGFDLYVSNIDPSRFLRVALKSDGTSFEKIITGYTFVATVAQNGNEFLNCESLIVNNILLKDVIGIDNFWFDDLGNVIPRTYTEIIAYIGTNISIDSSVPNKITNIKTYV